MITATISIQNPTESPEDCKTSIDSMLENSGVTDYELSLQGVDVGQCRFMVECKDTDTNYTLIVQMCGALNTNRDGGQLNPAQTVRAASQAMRAQAFQIAGSEGRFAKENPPPPGAK